MEPTLIFDYDGTIHDTLRIYEPAFRGAFAWLVENGYTKDFPVSRERIASWLGINSRDMWNSFLPQLPEEIKERASIMVGASMAERVRAGEASWYPGAEEMLDALKARGCRMVILSNCRISYRKAHWETFSMGRWFEKFYDCESWDFAPKTEIVKEIMKEFPGPYVVIGDRKGDLDCAKVCGGRAIGCLYGFGTPEELTEADVLAKDVSDIEKLV